jgi:putative two-component system hydrogenase maturation factor HypX/HoxX
MRDLKKNLNLMTHKNPKGSFKIPSLTCLKIFPNINREELEEIEENPFASSLENGKFRELKFYQSDLSEEIFFLEFNFYNGAMSKSQCDRMANALRKFKENFEEKNQKEKDPKKMVLILLGSKTNFSNGVNLNVIESSENPEKETMENLISINSVVKEILGMEGILTLTTFQANAGSGGVFLGLSSDFVFMDDHVILNPHYKKMGLFGSELHLPIGERRVGKKILLKMKENAEPIIKGEAEEIGFVDNLENEIKNFGLSEKDMEGKNFQEKIELFAHGLVSKENFFDILRDKKSETLSVLKDKNLDYYEEIELSEMEKDVYGNRNSYKEKKRNFKHL